jgi:putative acetyltransferase
MEMSVIIRPETVADHAAIHAVNERAFGQPDEAHLVAALRDGGHVTLSLVAVDDLQIVGHILFSELPIHSVSGVVPAIALAPMAVVPERQKQGIGTLLVERGLELCREHGHRIVVVLGHENFYPRFGFSHALAMTLDSPFTHLDAFMALELVPGGLDGVSGAVHYAPPFAIEPHVRPRA